MVWKGIEIGVSLNSTSTALTVVERSRPVMALATFNCVLLRLLVVVADSQGAKAVAAYLGTLCTTAM